MDFPTNMATGKFSAASRGASAAVVVYDQTNAVTFERAQEWVRQAGLESRRFVRKLPSFFGGVIIQNLNFGKPHLFLEEMDEIEVLLILGNPRCIKMEEDTQVGKSSNVGPRLC